ncbi:MAG: DUF362 domain-containing protein [candidate division Zixibacteria bacterium]|nr:DUF362 domain-containing protein [candidate division Zixibacteria bacterium]
MSKSRVVVVRSPGVISASGNVDKSVLSLMVRRGICRLTSESRAEDALGHFFSTKDTIGLKVNCLAGRMASTHPEIALVAADLLRRIEIKSKNIIIWDRSSYELKEVGFPLDPKGGDFLCFGTDAQGVGYSQELINQRSIGSLISQIMEKFTNAQLNLPVLKDHGLSGVTCSLKNFFGAIHNPNKYHDAACDPYIADLNALPQIRGQHKLVVCDALRVQFHGGPSYHPQWAENFGGVIIGDDPVAVDFVGYQMMDKMRRKHNLSSLEKAGRKPKHIFTAADNEHRLGKASLGEIELVEMTI